MPTKRSDTPDKRAIEVLSLSTQDRRRHLDEQRDPRSKGQLIRMS